MPHDGWGETPGLQSLSMDRGKPSEKLQIEFPDLGPMSWQGRVLIGVVALSSLVNSVYSQSQSLTLTATRTVSPSASCPLCPAGWTKYVNDGSESSDSCLMLSTALFSTWNSAMPGCPSGSHALTIRGTSKAAGGLFAASVTLNAGTLWIG